MPEAGVSHLHLMNNLPCHLKVQLQSSNFNQNFEVNGTMNHIVEGLKPGYFDLLVDPDSSCGLKSRNESIKLHDKKVRE